MILGKTHDHGSVIDIIGYIPVGIREILMGSRGKSREPVGRGKDLTETRWASFPRGSHYPAIEKAVECKRSCELSWKVRRRGDRKQCLGHPPSCPFLLWQRSRVPSRPSPAPFPA